MSKTDAREIWQFSFSLITTSAITLKTIQTGNKTILSKLAWKLTQRPVGLAYWFSNFLIFFVAI